MDFDIQINCRVLELANGSEILSAANKHLLTLLNDYEDGLWRAEKFHQFVWDNIAETALSHEEREALDAQPYSILTNAAKNLRLSDFDTEPTKGSEVAEIVLYGVMKHHYHALPVVPKIFYKQNAQDYAKGADSVHIVIGEEGDFTLWFGEAKFYSSIENARLARIVESVGNSLATDKLKKENSIITNLAELDRLGIEPNQLTAIKETLSNKASIDPLKDRINVPILLLHECEITATATAMSPEYLDEISQYHRGRAIQYFRTQADRLKGIHKYGAITFHLILFPVPKKSEIVNSFASAVSGFRG